MYKVKATLAAAALLLFGGGVANAVTATVPSTATGCFGYPNAACTPFVVGINVAGPGTITIKANGTITYGVAAGQMPVGPNGGLLTPASPHVVTFAYPLDQSVGINTAAYPTKDINHIGALIGAFVPKSVVTNPDFQPLDGTKGLTAVGIEPSRIFFIGTYHVIEVNTAGTLYLGINDNGADDNSGSFTVHLTTP